MYIVYIVEPENLGGGLQPPKPPDVYTLVTWVQVGFNSETLSFSPLRLSDAGQHTCHVSVSSDDEFRTHAANASSQPFQINVYSI